MKTIQSPTRFHFWRWCALGCLLLCALTVYGVASCFFLGRDAAALRDCVMRQTDGQWKKTIEIAVGPLPFNLVRFGLSFIDKVPPEARLALRAARGGEVGVYTLAQGGTRGSNDSLLASADRAMAQRSWDRLAMVVNGRDIVAIYVPSKPRSSSDFRTSLVVLKEREMVVVSARVNLEPLLELAKISKEGPSEWFASDNDGWMQAEKVDEVDKIEL